MSTAHDKNIVPFALLFEAALVPLALVLGWLLGVAPFDRLVLESTGLALGIAATVPMLALLWGSLRATGGPLARLMELARDAVARHFARASLTSLALISLAAGIGEEALFRGLLQEWLSAGVGPIAGLLIAALVFGAVHALSVAYFVAATAIGIYLGLVYLISDNLLPPIIAHALYDFVALVLLTRYSSGSVKRTSPNASGR